MSQYIFGIDAVEKFGQPDHDDQNPTRHARLTSVPFISMHGVLQHPVPGEKNAVCLEHLVHDVFDHCGDVTGFMVDRSGELLS